MARRRKEKFWAGSGKFFILVLVIYLSALGLKRVYESSGKSSGKFTVPDIQIENNKLINTAKILNLCGFSDHTGDKDSVVIEYKQLAKQLLQMVYLKGVSITRRPPNRLNITVDERKPLAFIYGKGLNLIDEEGYLMPVPETNCVWDLPIITGIQGSIGKLGEKTTVAGVYSVLEMIKRLQQENLIISEMISEINLSEKDYLIIYLVKGAVPVKVNKDTYNKELYVLKNYLANHVDWKSLRKMEYIDLRFKNQLIVKPGS